MILTEEQYDAAYLEHFGVLGMHWGVRKDREDKGPSRKEQRRQARFKKNKEYLMSIGHTEQSAITMANELETEHRRNTRVAVGILALQGALTLAKVGSEFEPEIRDAAFRVRSFLQTPKYLRDVPQRLHFDDVINVSEAVKVRGALSRYT